MRERRERAGDRQTDRQTYRQTDRQTETHTHRDRENCMPLVFSCNVLSVSQ